MVYFVALNAVKSLDFVGKLIDGGGGNGAEKGEWRRSKATHS